MSLRLLPLAAGVFAVASAAPSRSAPPAGPTSEVPVVQTTGPGAYDWPQWRGPNRDGKSAEKGLLQSWPEGGPPKLWTVGGLGQGFGTPSVAGGRIYVMGAVNGKDGVFCLNEADGKQLWFTPIDDAREAKPNLGPGSQPTVQNGMVYAVSNKGTLAALDLAGAVVWTRNYSKDFGGNPGAWGFNDSVLVDGDRVICAPSGKKGALAALNAKTGQTVWATPLDKIGGGAGYCSPIKMTVGSLPTYVCLLGQDAGVVGVHADNGKLLWHYNGVGAAGGTAQIPVPVFLGNKLFVSCSYNDKTGAGAALLELSEGGSEKIDVKVVKTYRKPEANNHHGGMVLVGKHIFFGHDQNRGIPRCVDITTGEMTYREDREPKGAGGSVAITYADGRLYYRFENHLLALVEPDPTGFKMVSSFELPEHGRAQSWAHPVVANGRLYIRDQEKLHCFDLKAGRN